jgi:ubiquinone/menaquinone biosynthesis C-methylase UbiE
MEPEVMGFAQFPRYHGKKMLEVGVGMGTDFLQWVRSGAEAYGIDLTPEGVRHTLTRLELYGLTAKEVRVADAESLPYSDNMFDLVYAWGVIHHSPNTEKALAEIVRVLKPGGTAKIMVYNRHSLQVFLMWVRLGLLKGQPWRSPRDLLWNHQESPGTKAYTHQEIHRILAVHPVENIWTRSPICKWELLIDMGKARWKEIVMETLAGLAGTERAGWWLMIQFKKKAVS